MQSITERLTNEPDAVQQATTHKSDYRTILTSVRVSFACDVLCKCTMCLTRRVFNACCTAADARSHAARARHDLMQDSNVCFSRARLGRALRTRRRVCTARSDLGQVGADSIAATAPGILMATKSKSSTTCHARVDPVDGQKEEEQGMHGRLLMNAKSSKLRFDNFYISQHISQKLT